jgi:hypothetical protein
MTLKKGMPFVFATSAMYCGARDGQTALGTEYNYAIYNIIPYLEQDLKRALRAVARAGSRVGPIRACRQAAGVVGRLPTAIQRISPPWGCAAGIFLVDFQFVHCQFLGLSDSGRRSFENQRPTI